MKCEIQGGRSGFIRFEDGERRASLEWETLVGEVQVVVYASGCKWTLPTEMPMARADIEAVVQECANLRGVIACVSFPNGSETVFRPNNGRAKK